MKKMLYVLNVDWNWIKQRPHFLAEELNKYFDLTIVYQHRYNRKGYQNRKDENLKLSPLFVIPRIDRYKYLKWINILIKKFFFRIKIKAAAPDYIYVTHPDHFFLIPSGFQGKVIYDCMDNHKEFISDSSKKKKLSEIEKKLADRADFIFVTSNRLKDIFIENYKNEHKISLVRNAFPGKILNIKDNESNKNSKEYLIGYFGTISSWFNFEYIEKSLNSFPDIRYLLIGPVDSGTMLPRHERINYIGTVEHDKLYDAVHECNALIMPFYINEIVLAVDPVKLYEYINFEKQILCIEYPEVKRFEKFAYFYNDYDSFCTQISKMINSELKYTVKDKYDFLLKSNWEYRALEIKKIISQ